jgi:hypothetical protein
MKTDYIFDTRNKTDVNLLKNVYDFCFQNCLIPMENNHVVVGHSVMEIEQALVNFTRYRLKYFDGKNRPYVTNKENNVNVGANTNNALTIKITGYLPRNKNLNPSVYDNVITCTDNTWSPYMYKNNTERKKNLGDADIYLMSGKYLLGYPFAFELNSLLPTDNVKLSFGFFKDAFLAKSTQRQINYISAGFEYNHVVYIKNILSNRCQLRLLQNAYKENYIKLKKGVCIVKNTIKKYNEMYEDYKVKYRIEPSKYYVYITSSDIDNIKKFKNFYNKLNLEQKLYISSSKQVDPELQTIWKPHVVNGAYIKNC